jgi:hypothetical protein
MHRVIVGVRRSLWSQRTIAATFIHSDFVWSESHNGASAAPRAVSARAVFPFTMTRIGSLVRAAVIATITVYVSFSFPCIGIWTPSAPRLAHPYAPAT